MKYRNIRFVEEGTSVYEVLLVLVFHHLQSELCTNTQTTWVCKRGTWWRGWLKHCGFNSQQGHWKISLP